jgi:hypothetical protein
MSRLRRTRADASAVRCHTIRSCAFLQRPGTRASAVAILAGLAVFVLAGAADATTTLSGTPICTYDRAAPNVQSALTNASSASMRIDARSPTNRAQPSEHARLARLLAAEEGLGDAATTAARIHGNSASSPATSYLYRLTNGQTGEYLKTGISKNPFSRYTSSFMQDKEMEILTSGSRREMLNLDRFIVERDPGPLNLEPWAGRYPNDVPGAP